MATNQLLPFASGENPNVIPFDDWNALPARLTGFLSGIASSQQFNRIFAQGGVAGYILGQLIVDQLNQDATLDPDTLYTNWKSAIAKFIPSNVADGSINASKIEDDSITFAKLATAAIATTGEAQAGTVANKLMTPQRVSEAISAQTPPALPTGSFIFFGGVDVPEGFLLCNGANVSRSDYAALFAVIGSKYGEGDGSSTFTLPNLDGRVLQGTNDTGEVGTYLEAQLPNITGQTTYGVFQVSAPSGYQGALYEASWSGTGNIVSGGNHWTSIGLDASKDDQRTLVTKCKCQRFRFLCVLKLNTTEGLQSRNLKGGS